MEKKCVTCHILLDIACGAPGCPGHHNESVGEQCAYCATQERDAGFFWRTLPPSIVSSLEDFEPDVDEA